jgi:hypothetical protein
MNTNPKKIIPALAKWDPAGARQAVPA